MSVSIEIMQNAKLLLNTRIRMYYRTINKPQHKRLYYPLEVKSYDLDQKVKQFILNISIYYCICAETVKEASLEGSFSIHLFNPIS